MTAGADDVEACIAAAVVDTSPAGIAKTIAGLVSTDNVAAGSKLPTIRRLAGRLGVSTNTVADAWRILQGRGLISTDRRRGTTVRGLRQRSAGRYWQVPVEPGTIELDLSTGTPDQDLLPPLGPVLHELHTDVGVTSYVDPPLLDDLEAELRRRWPFPAEAFTVVDGALDALDRAVQELVSFGDVVVVEDPTFPPLIDMLELAGAEIVGAPVDAGGVSPDAISDAMALDPVALFLQPRAHNPTGAHLTAERAQAIAALVANTDVIVVEDDHSGSASGAPMESVGEHVPGQVLHIRSFSKSHGPDLRIAAVGGPAGLVNDIVRRRRLGPSWTSRLIQQILHAMLTDADTDTLVRSAADTYRTRREELEARLVDLGVEVEPGVGLNMWIRVDDEQRAVVALAAHGIGVAPGAPFRVNDSGDHHIRLSVGALRRDLDRVATTVAAAAASPPATTGL